MSSSPAWLRGCESKGVLLLISEYKLRLYLIVVGKQVDLHHSYTVKKKKCKVLYAEEVH